MTILIVKLYDQRKTRCKVYVPGSTITPALNYVGPLQISVTVSDGVASSPEFKVDVNESLRGEAADNRSAACDYDEDFR